MMKYIKICGLFFISFFIPYICMAEAIDDIARDVDNIASDVGVIKDTAKSDQGVLGDIRDSLTLDEEGLLGDVKSLTNDNKSILESIKNNIGIRGQEAEDSFIGSVLYYLREIYNFLHKPLADVDVHPEYRYVEFKKINDALKEKKQEMMDTIDNIIEDKDSIEPEEVYSGVTNGTKVNYSSLSADSFYGTDIYENEAQQSAAEGFVINTVGSISFPESSDSDDEGYGEYRNMMIAIQSFAASNLVDSYIERIPFEVNIGDKEQTVTNSKRNLLKEMNIADSSEDTYWNSEDSPGNLGIAQRALLFFNSFFALNYTLNQVYEQLNRANIQLSLMLTQNMYLGNKLLGSALLQRSGKQFTYDDLKSGEDDNDDYGDILGDDDVGGMFEGDDEDLTPRERRMKKRAEKRKEKEEKKKDK